MTQEIIYTSAPSGLKPGSRGFCTVVATRGIAKPLADQLEDLSGYRHLSPSGGASSTQNPVVFSHLKLSVASRTYHVLSRICDAGNDYTNRTNKLAHHVALEPAELVPGGPAALLQTPGFMTTAWSGQPAVRDVGPVPPHVDAVPTVCRAWAQISGDAGWGGAVAEVLASESRRQIVLIYKPSIDVLSLVAETLALLPPQRRWEATFCTYFTKLPPTVDCRWRCVVDGTPEADSAPRAAGALVIDLRKPLPPPPESAFVQAARLGTAIPVATLPITRPRQSAAADADDLLLAELERNAPLGRILRPNSNDPIATTAIAYGLTPPPIQSTKSNFVDEMKSSSTTRLPRPRKDRHPAFWMAMGGVLCVLTCCVCVAAFYAWTSAGNGHGDSVETAEAAMVLGPQKPKPEAPKPEAPKPEAPKPEAPKPEAPKPENKGTDTAATQSMQNNVSPGVASQNEKTAASNLQVPLHDYEVVYIGRLDSQKRSIDLPVNWDKLLANTDGLQLRAINLEHQSLRVIPQSAGTRISIGKLDQFSNTAEVASFEINDGTLTFSPKTGASAEDISLISSSILRITKIQNGTTYVVDFAFWKMHHAEPFSFVSLSDRSKFTRLQSNPFVESVGKLGEVGLVSKSTQLKHRVVANKDDVWELELSRGVLPEIKLIVALRLMRQGREILLRCEILPRSFSEDAWSSLAEKEGSICDWDRLSIRLTEVSNEILHLSDREGKIPNEQRDLSAKLKQTQKSLPNLRPQDQELAVRLHAQLASLEQESLKLQNELKRIKQNLPRLISLRDTLEKYNAIIQEAVNAEAEINYRVVIDAQNKEKEFRSYTIITCKRGSAF